MSDGKDWVYDTRFTPSCDADPPIITVRVNGSYVPNFQQKLKKALPEHSAGVAVKLNKPKIIFHESVVDGVYGYQGCCTAKQGEIHFAMNRDNREWLAYTLEVTLKVLNEIIGSRKDVDQPMQIGLVIGTSAYELSGKFFPTCVEQIRRLGMHNGGVARHHKLPSEEDCLVAVTGAVKSALSVLFTQKAQRECLRYVRANIEPHGVFVGFRYPNSAVANITMSGDASIMSAEIDDSAELLALFAGLVSVVDAARNV